MNSSLLTVQKMAAVRAGPGPSSSTPASTPGGRGRGKARAPPRSMPPPAERGRTGSSDDERLDANADHSEGEVTEGQGLSLKRKMQRIRREARVSYDSLIMSNKLLTVTVARLEEKLDTLIAGAGPAAPPDNNIFTVSACKFM